MVISLYLELHPSLLHKSPNRRYSPENNTIILYLYQHTTANAIIISILDIVNIFIYIRLFERCFIMEKNNNLDSLGRRIKFVRKETEVTVWKDSAWR